MNVPHFRYFFKTFVPKTFEEVFIEQKRSFYTLREYGELPSHLYNLTDEQVEAESKQIAERYVEKNKNTKLAVDRIAVLNDDNFEEIKGETENRPDFVRWYDAEKDILTFKTK